jgi:hypothetical protein
MIACLVLLYFMNTDGRLSCIHVLTTLYLGVQHMDIEMDMYCSDEKHL